MTNRILYIVVCGAPLASRTADGVKAARANGWDPYVIPTEAAMPWLADQDLRDVPVITGNRTPDQPKRTPPADAVAVVPMTFNTLNAWANGNANTYPLTTLCAALGSRTRTAAIPFAKHDLAGHPAWLASLAVLRYAGVTIVDPQNGSRSSIEPIASGTGNEVASAFHWEWVFASLEHR
ncbi:flavoprotein [Kribbella flavida DSM 17836]|uniref:Flavoprotein n=1 Tax=Kribbella flavida (strain DSM 17836 / JCM 10339 / NBRC 14399) TaxID=479435 RepID=D2PKT1_KRIFD|nr:flavoprotein [Kribbella flavida]ADB32398.1 flavoprotein [Kribbella flavida DSM 17836]